MPQTRSKKKMSAEPGLSKTLDDQYHYDWKESGSASTATDKTAFGTGIKERDQIEGISVCVVCGTSSGLQKAHIIPQRRDTDDGAEQWMVLKHLGWVPQQANDDPMHEPRNGISLCPNHRSDFVNYRAFVHFFPRQKVYVWFSFRQFKMQDDETLHEKRSEAHGVKLYLDADHQLAPIYSLFLIHEHAARGHNPFDCEVTQDVDLDQVKYHPKIQERLEMRDAARTEVVGSGAGGAATRRGAQGRDKGGRDGGRRGGTRGGSRGDGNSKSAQKRPATSPPATPQRPRKIARTLGRANANAVHRIGPLNETMALRIKATKDSPSHKAAAAEGFKYLNGTTEQNMAKWRQERSLD